MSRMGWMSSGLLSLLAGLSLRLDCRGHSLRHCIRDENEKNERSHDEWQISSNMGL